MTKQPGFPQKPTLRQVKKTASQKEKEATSSGMCSPLQAPAGGSVEQTSAQAGGGLSPSPPVELGVPASWMAKWAWRRPQEVAGAGSWSWAGAPLQQWLRHLYPSRCSPWMPPTAPTTSTAPSGQVNGHGSLRHWPSRLLHFVPHCRSTQPSATASGDLTRC